MPWRETCPMDERRRFIDDLLSKDWSMVDLCRLYGISRKTGYKWLDRHRCGGLDGLVEQSRRPWSHPKTTPEALEARIIELRQKHPFWGPRKLLHRLRRLQPDTDWPAPSTIGSILDRNGLVIARSKRRRTPAYERGLSNGLGPNDVWAADFKGWFRTANGTRVDPLTISDVSSRYLIRCRAVAKTNGESVRAQFTAAFQEFGLPSAIRTDNGSPFASTGLAGLSKLSVWLMKLGVRPERIRPGHPEENGVHERMHRTLKQETAKPPQATLRAQQEAFDRFRGEYNEARPHEAIGMQVPAQLYYPSARAFPLKPKEVEYPRTMTVRRVNTNGCIRWNWDWIFVSCALEGEPVGLDPVDDSAWAVRYGQLQVGILNERSKTIQRV